MAVGSSETGESGSRAGRSPAIEVLVFAKKPVPGRVKTRIAADLGPDCAAELAAAFLRDTLDRVVAWSRENPGVEVVILGTPSDPTGFDAFRPAEVEFRAQSEGHLGRRMRAATLETHHRGRGAILLGADTPDFPLSILDSALGSLARGVISLTPSTDGGFSQIGLPRGIRMQTLDALFAPSEWGTPVVLDRARRALSESPDGSEETTPFRDIDDLEDLVKWWERDAPLTETPRSAAVIRARLGTRPEFR